MSQKQILVASLRPEAFKGPLDPEGYQLVLARSFEEAASLLASHAPDLLILDALGPDRDALKAIRDLKAIGQRLPVILAVCTPKELEGQDGTTLPANDFLMDGFTPAELKLRVRSQLELHGLDRAVFQMRDSFQDMLMYDLRAPLASIMVGLEYLAAIEGLPTGTAKVIDTLGQNCADLESALQNFLDLERREDEGFKLAKNEFELSAFLVRLASSLKPSLAVRRVQLEIQGSARPVHADEKWLRRLVQGLIQSAGKLSSPGSNLLVTVSQDEGAARLTVSYSGQAIPAEARKKIFDRYFHREKGGWIFPRGVGLALGLCRKIAEAHMGRIWVEGDKEGESSFVVLLPSR